MPSRIVINTRLLRAQGNVCAGPCGGYHLTMVLDHDHETDLVRGVLCPGCNSAEGRAPEDDPFWSQYRLHPPAELLGMEVQYSTVT